MAIRNALFDFSILTRPGIGRKFALYILLFSSIVTLTSTIVQLSLEFKRDVDEIQRSLRQVRTSYSESLAGSLWVISKKDVQLQIDGILRLPDMQYLEVTNENNEIVSTVGERSDKRVLREETPLYYTHQNKQIFVGTLVSVASLDGAYKRLVDKVLVILVSQGIKTFLVSFFILVLFQYLIGRHLAKIARHSESLDTTSPEQTLQLDRAETDARRGDELSVLVFAINNMRTRLRNAFNKLLQSEENSRVMVEAVQDYAIIRLDPAGNIVTWNIGGQRIFGYSAVEVIGKPFSLFFSIDDRDKRLLHQYLNEAQQKERTECEGLRIRKDGTVFWVDGSITTLYDSAKQLIGYSSVTRDISERRRAEKEQQRLNRALRLLSDSNLLLVNTKDESELLSGVCDLIVYTAGYVAAWVGFPENDEGKTVRPIAQTGFGAEYIDEIRVSWDESRDIGRGATGTAIRTHKPQIFQHGLSSPQLSPWRSTVTKRGIQSGLALPMLMGERIIGVLSLYSSDPTAFTPEEIALLEELSRNISFGIERLRSISERESAQTANQAKTAFLANMSHEIRTPLNAILGSAQLLRREELTPRQKDRLDTIDSAGEHLLEVINTILDLSKIEAGKFTLEEGPVHIEKIISSVNALLSERANAKRLTLSFEIQPVPKYLLGDATRLKQALLNYTGNAIKFTETGTIAIRARVDKETPTDVLIRFEVQDTGIGISADSAKRLFSAFEQVDGSTTRKYGGTGLGLAITKKLAHLMGGNAGVDSTPGTGSTFWFTARLKKGTSLESNNELTTTEREKTTIKTDFSRCRVLIVDDEPVNRKLLLDILEVLGPQVDVAENGSVAVRLTSKNQYDLILMDMQMPIMDGLDATRKIRALAHYASTPIIALTGNAFTEDRIRCIAAGMTDFIAKPFDIKQLLSKVSASLIESSNAIHKEVL